VAREKLEDLRRVDRLDQADHRVAERRHDLANESHATEMRGSADDAVSRLTRRDEVFAALYSDGQTGLADVDLGVLADQFRASAVEYGCGDDVRFGDGVVELQRDGNLLLRFGDGLLLRDEAIVAEL